MCYYYITIRYIDTNIKNQKVIRIFLNIKITVRLRVIYKMFVLKLFSLKQSIYTHIRNPESRSAHILIKPVNSSNTLTKVVDNTGTEKTFENFPKVRYVARIKSTAFAVPFPIIILICIIQSYIGLSLIFIHFYLSVIYFWK